MLILVIGLAECSSKKESLAVVNKYFDNIKSDNFSENYDYLSNESKKDWTKENYDEFERMKLEAYPVTEVKVEKNNEYKDKEIDGIKYQEVVEYNVTEFYHDKYNDNDANSNYVMDVVNENSEWKIYLGEKNVEEKISQAKYNVAIMYFTGKGENEDADKAQDIVNESIKENPEYSNSYYLLGCMYNYLGRYDEVISIGEQNIDKAKTDEEKSNQYYMIGKAYEGKKDYTKAKDCYTQSLEANANNKYAKSNLSKLNTELK